MKFKFALVHRQRREPEPGLRGECQGCGHAMVARCGEIREWHWAHLEPRICDPWWEPKTDWHRAWQNRFSVDWQEVVHRAEDGEKHIADVKTEHGWVIEVQHSYLKPEERRARSAFYGPKMVWVVNGLRRQTDYAKFQKILNLATVVNGKPLALSVPSGEGALLRDWGAIGVPVYFDFGENNHLEDVFHFGAPVLWCLHPKGPEGRAILLPVRRTEFIEAFRTGAAVSGMDYAKIFEVARKPMARQRPAPQAMRSPKRSVPMKPRTYAEYVAMRYRARSRGRL